MPRVVIGLGSNVGDRLSHVRAAVARITSIAGATCARVSSLYETMPVGGPPQDDFINLAVVIDWRGDLHALLDELQHIERDLGRDREREQRWGPRTIDLDLLWAEDLALATPRLEVPHARLHERAFALRPLLELVPDARDPRNRRLLSELPCTGARVRPLAAGI